MKTALVYASATLAISSGLGAAPAFAQQGQDPASEEADQSTAGRIVVTAQRREQSVIEVPVSVTVADQAALERQQVNNIADLSRLAPALEVQQATGQNVGGGGQIRGIGTTSFQIGALGSVGIVVDQVSQGNVNISDLFDVERVEVLKGPQGTLFGLTTSAGVINVTTRRPEFGEFSGRVRTELSDAGTLGSEYGRQTVQGVVNLPIADNAAMRVSGNFSSTQGIDRNAFTGELDEHTAWGVRSRLLWEPTENLTVNLIGEYSETEDEQGADFFKFYIAGPVIAQELAACGITASRGNRDYCTNFPAHAENSILGGSAQFDYDFGGAVLTSVTALRRQESGPNSLNIFRLDTHPTRIFNGPGFGEVDLFSQEFRLASDNGSRLEYTLGAYLSDQDTTNFPSPFGIFVTLPNGVVINPVSSAGSLTEVDDTSMAVFGQGTYQLTDNFRLIFGGRYTNQQVNAMTTNAANLTSTSSVEINNFSWRFGGQIEATPDVVIYGTIARGYKGPQIRLADPSNPTAVTQIINEEVPTSFELGVKASVFDDRVFLEANVFNTDVQDYQGQVCVISATGNLQCAPQNIGDVTSSGFELAVSGRPMDGLNFNAGLIYNDVDYPTGLVGSDGSLIGGTQLANAPEWKFTVSAEYAFEVSPGFEFFAAGDAIHKTEFKVAQSTDPNVIYPANWTLGGRIGVRDPDGGWTVSVFGRNLTNNHEPVFALAGFPDAASASYGQITTSSAFRQVGLSLDVRF